MRCVTPNQNFGGAMAPVPSPKSLSVCLLDALRRYVLDLAFMVGQ